MYLLTITIVNLHAAPLQWHFHNTLDADSLYIEIIYKNYLHCILNLFIIKARRGAVIVILTFVLTIYIPFY